MPRPNCGPRLVAYKKRGGTFYIVWSEKGRSRERSTGTRDRGAAEIELGRFLLSRPANGPIDPSQRLITDHEAGSLTRSVPVELPEPPPPRERWLTRAEAARLLKAAMDEPRVRLHLPLFIVIGLYSGQRKEAILSLRWPQVNLDKGLMDFRVPGRRRTKKGRSHTQIPPRLLTHLRNARKRGSDLGHVVHEHGMALKDIKRGFSSACRRAGLTDVTPHTLRHTCATWLMQRSVPKWEAAGFLAMSLETLERTYGHHHPDHHSTAALSFSRRAVADR